MAPYQKQRSRPRPLTIVSLGDQLEQARARSLGNGRHGPEVPTEVALAVVLVGLVCCGLGWLIAPVGTRSDATTGWYALVISTLFWTSAFMAAVGLFVRVRRGLIAATVCAMSFLGAVAIGAVLDSTVIGFRWGVELGLALVFWLACVGAFLLTDRV